MRRKTGKPVQEGPEARLAGGRIELTSQFGLDASD